MALDDKKENIGKDGIPVSGVIEGEIELDLSDLDLDDGSVSEPSFSSDKKEENINQNDDVEEIPDDEGIEELGDDEVGEEEPINDDDTEEILDDESGNEEESLDNGDNSVDENPVEDNTPSEETSSESAEESTESSEPSESTSEESEPTESSSDDSESATEDSSNETVSEPTSDTSSDTSDSTETSDTKDSGSDTSSEDTSSKESATDDKSTGEESKSSSSDSGSSNEQTKPEEGSDKNGGKSDKKDETKDKKDGKPDGKDAAKNAGDNAKDAAKDAAKDTAKDAAKDAAKDTAKDAAKDVAKDAAKDAAKEGAKDLAKDAAKDNPAADKAEIAKNTKDALKQGPKGLSGAPGIRAALAASENTNAYSKAGATAVKVLDKLIGKENTDKLLDKLGESALKSAAAGLIMGLISLLLPIIFLALGIYMIFAPMLDALMNAEKIALNVANTAEKIANLYANGNFADSKETFYAELDRLGSIYGEELDSTLLLATTFYSEMKSGYQTDYSSLSVNENYGMQSLGIEAAGSLDDDTDTDAYMANFSQLIQSEIEKVEKEAGGTYDPETGYWYTIGKVYRLKLLANAMFDSTFLGTASSYTQHEMSLSEWIVTYGGDYQDAVIQMMKDVLSDVGKSAAITLLTGIPIPIISQKSVLDAKILINCLFLGCMSVQSIKLPSNIFTNNVLDEITITYYSYKYSEENYRKYLKEKFIPNNPDFKPYLSYDKDGKVIEESIDNIIDEIFAYKDYFDRLFTIQDEDDSEDYNQLCIGAIDRKLASSLSDPVDINTSNCIEFLDKNGYGYTTDGKLHNGIELNKDSTGNVEGDKVYAVMDGGTVKASSADSTMECTGGCIEIEYKYTMDGTAVKSQYDFSIIYKGLSKSSVKLKTGDTVTDRQEVGTIGTAAESEGLSVPSLYLEFRKLDGTAIDPTNMIVKCTAHVGDYPGATTITIPQTFTQANEYSFTCYGGKGWYYGCKSSDERTWGEGQGQRATYEVWVSQGSRFKNGIAYITVDGVDRYLSAVVPDIGLPGDVLNAKFKDGSIAPLVVMDTKGEGVDSTGWGHPLSGATDVIEFEVELGHPTGNVTTSGWGIEWESSNNPVLMFTNNGNIHSGTFDLKGGSSSSQSTASGVKLCDSMYVGNKTGAIANKAIEIANNDAIGNTNDVTKRSMNPDVDNASFIYYSVVNSGVMDGQESVFTIDEMEKVLTEHYFTKSEYKEAEIKKGDILVYEKDSKKIAIIYIGEEKQVWADPSKENADSGDADGTEVLISAFDKTLSYTAVYRYDYEKQYGPISKTNNSSMRFLTSKSSLFSY
ncbi:MAG: peptidoglycan DD-metalloendopeptidase family protein [Bacilli bacterium]|nr:peptidoglycan DD-metalloendopeptidase family protein [Bacilli bacterium]